MRVQLPIITKNVVVPNEMKMMVILRDALAHAAGCLLRIQVHTAQALPSKSWLQQVMVSISTE